MNKQRVNLYCFCFLLLLSACNHPVDNKRLTIFRQADSLSETAPDSAFALLEGLEHFQEMNDADFACWCLLSGKIFNYRTDTDKVFLPAIYYERASKYYMQYGTPEEKSYIQLYLGRAYQETAEYNKAMRTYTEALKDAEEWQEYNSAGMISCYMGDIYSNQYLSDKSIEKYKEAIGYFKLAGNQQAIALTLRDIGFEYVLDEQPAIGLPYLLQADSIANILQDVTVVNIAQSLGAAYIELENFLLAEQYLLKALQYAKTKADSTRTYYSLSDVYIAAGDYDKAREVLEMGIDSWTMEGAYYQLYLIEKGEGDYEKALAHLVDYQGVADSVRMKQNRMHVLEIEKQYNLEHAENQKNKAQIEALRYLMFFLVALVGLLFTTTLYQRMRQQKNKIIIRQRENLDHADQAILDISTQLQQAKENLKDSHLFIKQSNEEHNTTLSEQKGKINELNEELFRAKLEKITQVSAIGQKIRKATEKMIPVGKELTSSDWNTLIRLFRTTYPSLDLLVWNPVHPLTEGEVRMSLLAFFNLEAKQEASLMNIQPVSAYKQRTRLRQSLHLDEGVHLFDFFKTYCIQHE